MSEPLAIDGYPTAPTKRNIVDWMLVTDLVGDVGLNDWISVGLDIPLMSVKRVDPSTIATTPVYDNHFAMGDIELHAKFNPLSLDDYPVGVSAVPFLVIPSGSTKNYTGDENVTGGIKGVVDWQYDRFYLSAMAGFNLRADSETLTYPGTTGSLTVGNEFLYGAGTRIDIISRKLQLLIDVVGSTTFSDFAEHEKSSPIDAMGGLRWFFKDRLVSAQIGGGSGLNHGYGAAQYRFYGGVTIQYPETKYPTREYVKPTIVTEEKERTIVFKGVYFETASGRIKPESYAVLDENVKMLKDNPDIEARIEGHTDDRGSDAYNKRLSQERADSVKEYFVKHGIAKSRLTAVGMGESHPIAPNNSAENMAKNRRIEMHIKVKNTIQRVVD